MAGRELFLAALLLRFPHDAGPGFFHFTLDESPPVQKSGTLACSCWDLLRDLCSPVRNKSRTRNRPCVDELNSRSVFLSGDFLRNFPYAWASDEGVARGVTATLDELATTDSLFRGVLERSPP